MKRCTRCGAEKALTDFYTDRKARDRRPPDCKVCNLARRKAKYEENPRPYIDRAIKWQRDNPERVRATAQRFTASGKRKVSNRKSHLKRKYGLTLETFDELLASQVGGCAICGRTDADNVDHDHASGRVRGILCFNCNITIGQAQDDEDRLAGAMAYLARDDLLTTVARSRVVALAG
jgi:Recombination endonuclease VII